MKTTNWEALDGAKPINNLAKAVVKKQLKEDRPDFLRDRIAELEKENMLFKQEIIKQDAEIEYLLETESKLLDSILVVAKYAKLTEK